MTITLFVKPESLIYFLEVTKILKKLDIENNYVFNPLDLNYTEQMISNYVWINMEVEEYLKLRYCTKRLKHK